MILKEYAAIDIETKDGKTYSVDESGIIRDSLTTSSSCSSGGGIPAGSCNAGTISVSFRAPSGLVYSKLAKAKVHLYVWYGNASKTKVGVYNITSAENNYGIYTVSGSDNVGLLDDGCYSAVDTKNAQNWLFTVLSGKFEPVSVIFNQICNAYGVPHYNSSENQEIIPESGNTMLCTCVSEECSIESVKDFASYMAEYLGCFIVPAPDGRLRFCRFGDRKCSIELNETNIQRGSYQRSPYYAAPTIWKISFDSGYGSWWYRTTDIPDNAVPLSVNLTNNPFWQAQEDMIPDQYSSKLTQMIKYMWSYICDAAYADDGKPCFNPFRCTVFVQHYFRVGDMVTIVDPFTGEKFKSYVTDVTWKFRGGQQISFAGEDTRTLSVNTCRNAAKKANDYSKYLYRKSKNGSGENVNTKYALSKSGHTITLTGSDGTVYNVTDDDTIYTHPTHTAHAKGFYKFANDGEGHVTDAEEVTASDLYNAGGVIKNHLNFADYTGHMSIAFMSTGTSGSFGDYAKFVVDTRETSVSKMFMLSIGGSGIEGCLMLKGQNGSECVIFPNSNSSQPNRFHFFLPDKSGTFALTDDIPDISGKQDKLTAGTNITINGNTINAKDTTYNDATQSAHGLMTAADKKKLDGMDLSKYLPLAGGVMTGNIDMQTNGKDILVGTQPASAYGTFTPVSSGQISESKAFTEVLHTMRSYIGTYNYKTASIDNWYNLISVRHRNGYGDGSNWGMVIYASLFGGDLCWDLNTNKGAWQGERVLLDSVNFTRYAAKSSHTHEMIVNNSKLISGSNNAAQWCRLGTLISFENFSTAVISVWSGDGANGLASQNSWFEIHIKDGWQSSQSATSACGVTVYRTRCSTVKVKVIPTAHNTFTVWVYLPWAYWNGNYAVNGRYKTWTSDFKNQPTEPEGTGANTAYYDQAFLTSTVAKATEATTLTDSGWIVPTFPSGINTSSIRYRKQGKIVTVTGYVRFSTTVSSKTVTTLPAGYRPPSKIKTCNVVDGATEVYTVTIGTDGSILFSGIRQGFFIAGTDYYMHYTFFVD